MAGDDGAFFAKRSRVMSPNNKKQAMLPTTAEILDNPIGTACGFAMDIGKARFFFTPGVPRELRRMLEEQIIPRLLAKSGTQTAIHLKRFHSYGLGESHVDQLAGPGVEDAGARRQRQARLPRALSADRDQADGARRDHDDIDRKLGPVVAEVRKRLGNFILAEDDDTLEGVILKALARDGWLARFGRDLHRRPDGGANHAAAGRRERVAPRHRLARPRRDL
jgi:nicotinamide-nucleotide amidase